MKAPFILCTYLRSENFLTFMDSERRTFLNLILDIDGTLMNGSVAYEGAISLVDRLNNENTKYLLMTNSIRKPELQEERLRNAGLDVRKENILNPIAAINEYLKERNIKRARIIGTDEEIGQVNAECDMERNEIAILLDFEKGNKGYSDLQAVLEDMEKGKEVVTASMAQFYYKSGRKTIDTGAFAELLEKVGGKKIRNFGKPSIDYFEIAGRMLAEPPSGIFVVGDDWSTDVKGAKEWGAKSILVKTGKYVVKDEEKEEPFMLIDNLLELKEYCYAITGK